MHICVFSPHFDDESIGIGGTIAKHISKGDSVSIHYMTDGLASHISYNGSAQAYSELRNKEAINAIKILFGSKKPVIQHLNFSEGFLRCTAKEIEICTSIIRSKKPQIIYVPHKNDNHPDHKVTNEIIYQSILKAETGYFPSLGLNPHKVNVVREYEIWSPISNPNLYISIDNYLDIKKDAINCYASQIQHRNYADGILGLNRYRGFQCRQKGYAEAFWQQNIFDCE